jgi:hypothetical protein
VPRGSEHQPTAADDADYPPPPPFPVTLPPFSATVVGFPRLSVEQVTEMDISPEGGGVGSVSDRDSNRTSDTLPKDTLTA